MVLNNTNVGQTGSGSIVEYAAVRLLVMKKVGFSPIRLLFILFLALDASRFGY